MALPHNWGEWVSGAYQQYCLDSTILNLESNEANRVYKAEGCTVAETISAVSDQTHRNYRRPAKKLGRILKQKRRLVKLDDEERAKGKCSMERVNPK